MTTSGQVGKVHLSTADDLRASNFIRILRPDSSAVVPKYLLYSLLLDGVRAAMARHIGGSTIQNLRGGFFEEPVIPVAPLPEQGRIVEAIEEQLSRLDAADESMREVRVRLAQLRLAVLFAGVEGRLIPQGSVGTSAAEHVHAGKERRREFWLRMYPTRRYAEPRPLGNCPPRELPEGWCWASMDEVVSRVTVGHVGPMKHEYVDEGIPFLRSQNVRANHLDSSGLKFIRPTFDEKLGKSRLEPGDVVVVRSGAVGVACVIPDTLPQANCADLVVLKQPTAVSPAFCAYYMNSLARSAVRAGQVGVALTHFNTKSVAALPVPVPPPEEQERIVSEVERSLSLIESMESAASDARARGESVRRTVLRDAFAGRLTEGLNQRSVAPAERV